MIRAVARLTRSSRLSIQRLSTRPPTSPSTTMTPHAQQDRGAHRLERLDVVLHVAAHEQPGAVVERDDFGLGARCGLGSAPAIVDHLHVELGEAVAGRSQRRPAVEIAGEEAAARIDQQEDGAAVGLRRGRAPRPLAQSGEAGSQILVAQPADLVVDGLARLALHEPGAGDVDQARIRAADRLNRPR